MRGDTHMSPFQWLTIVPQWFWMMDVSSSAVKVPSDTFERHRRQCMMGQL
jgi:hypothetical protein